MLPEDILEGARSVISFFLPFDKSIVTANAKSDYTAREWAVAYIETNQLIDGICASLSELLSVHGYQSAWELPTYSFDPVQLISRWSHKSVGVVAGLGSFGLHQMVITDLGCAGALRQPGNDGLPATALLNRLPDWSGAGISPMVRVEFVSSDALSERCKRMRSTGYCATRGVWKSTVISRTWD